MTAHYLDPSAWVKRYFEEVGSDSVAAVFDRAEFIACSRIGMIEVAATIARKGRYEKVNPAVLAGLLDQARSDYSAFEVIALDDEVAMLAQTLAFKHGLRAGDAIHLASALSLAGREGITRVAVVSADAELLSAAAAEGLEATNPEAR